MFRRRGDIFSCYLLVGLLSFVQSGPCSFSFDENACKYNMVCHGKFSGYSWDYFSVNYFLDNYNYNSNSPTKCVNQTAASIYSIENVFPITLNFRDIDFSSNDQSDQFTVPGYSGLTENLIESLNISSNDIRFTPILTPMEKLVSLNMSNNFLSIAQLSNVHELPSLADIDLSVNNILEIQTIEGQYPYTSLRHLNLSYNYLVGLPDMIFDDFRLLESIDLSHNSIEVLSSNTFEGTRKLLTLNLAFNRISDINTSLFRFVNLKELHLQNNRLVELKANEFENLISLQYVDLSFNSIAVVEKNVFWNLLNISQIDLSNNKIQVIDDELFKNTTTLKTINFSNNNIKRLPTDLFKGNDIARFEIQMNNLEGSLKKGTFNGLKSVLHVRLDHMHIRTIENFAFFGLDNAIILLLNDNEIENLSVNSFKTLRNLAHLDLSNNKIKHIQFETDDLLSLHELLLRNNFLSYINSDSFQGLNSLLYLDLSNNNISRLYSNSFASLKSLVNFEIGNNPLVGALEERSFDGLSSLPTLDISGTLLTVIQNNSFEGMIKLKNVNMSHSNIERLQYNAFAHTGDMDTLDVSYNMLIEFNLNNTQISSLTKLLLNNNFIKTISDRTLLGLTSLKEIILTHNKIEHFSVNSLLDQIDLNFLDISFNDKLAFNANIVKSSMYLNKLIISGLEPNISLIGLGNSSVAILDISCSKITNVQKLHLNELKRLDDLKLYKNNIIKLEVGAFSDLKSMRFLDLSYNKISYIQPGVFKDNILLHSLNISHNLLTQIQFGIFSGLVYLSSLDISYNDLDDLKGERFYQLQSLTTLIADNNRISTISAEDFMGTNLKKLSIGGNPLPCEIIVKFKQNDVPFELTSLRIDEHSAENFEGIVCNVNRRKEVIGATDRRTIYGEENKMLMKIRDILLKFTENLPLNNRNDNISVTVKNDLSQIKNITSKLEKTLTDDNVKLYNATNTIADENRKTNDLLEKMLRILSYRPKIITTNPTIVKGNATYENLLSYVNEIKQNIEDRLKERQNVLNDLQNDIAQLHSRIEILAMTEEPRHERLSKAQDSSPATNSGSMFTEVCVAFILIILLCFILYKLYKKKSIFKRRLSISTRVLPGNMENSDL
ncbi:protein artichoke-like [Bombyx mandarina]|uniref:Protein artichoke-like n=1 Tax=Bombyx mandarina TaxID=7092 RepID=A0A6J2KN57_BOMMA|nr:protein artichoke-like [Bombyx mandarina]